MSDNVVDLTVRRMGRTPADADGWDGYRCRHCGGVWFTAWSEYETRTFGDAYSRPEFVLLTPCKEHS